MSNKVKKGWRKWRFDQMAVMVNDRIDDPSEANVEHYVGLEHLDSGSLAIRRWGSPSDVEATKLRFRAGDIIFGRRRVYQRKLGVPHFDGICSAHAMVLRAKPEVVLPEFLPFFMQSDLFMERAKQISVGSLSPTINWKTLAQEEFALPMLDEQNRIAEVLEALKEQNEALHLTSKNGRLLEKAVFRNSLCGILEGYRGAMQQSRFGPVPSYWEVASIASIASVAYGISEAVASNKDPSIGWPILTGANITLSGTLDLAKIVYIKEPKKDDFILREGDLLLNWRSGSEEHVGKTAIFDLDGHYTYASFILRIRTDDRMNNLFLWRLLNHMREFHLFGTATSQQVNFKMNAAVFREVEVLVPPRKAQDEIVARLQELWNAENVIRRRLKAVDDLRNRMIEGAI